MTTRPDKQISRVRAREIGRGLRDIRERAGLSQYDIGPLSQATVYNLEHGWTQPSFYILDNYVRIFGVEEVEKAVGWRV